MKISSLVLVVIALSVGTAGFAADGAGRPASLYPVVRTGVSPADGAEAALNPPTFLWPRPGYRADEAGNTRFDPPKTFAPETVFQVELARNEAFTVERLESRPTRACFFKPERALGTGKWFWRYRATESGKTSVSPVFSFTIDEKTPVFVTPPVEMLVRNLPRQRPYIQSYGKSRQAMLVAAQRYPALAAASIKSGEKALKLPFIDIKTLDVKKIGFSAWLGAYSGQAAALPALCRAYLLTGEDKYREMAYKRMDQILSFGPLRGMDGAEHAWYLGAAYDTLHDQLDPALKQRTLAALQDFLAFYYRWWPGDKELLFLENHFWQKELSGFFIAALATVADVPENIKYLEYAYGIFLARVPVAGGNDGGWANGLPYFTVNYNTVAGMAFYLHTVGKVNIFEMPWYRNLPSYYLYCGMPGTTMDGFGNMHDRAYGHYKNSRVGWNFGNYMCQVIAVATGDPMAKAYCALTPERDAFLALAQNSELKFTPEECRFPALPQAKMFREVGVSAMHTDVMNPKKDMAVYFRASPFGNYGHMHANQNAFNIAFRGERIFYSSGYYTNFDDRHNLTSYRHTGAHNAILINGRGQSLGPEGYAWIKRFGHGGRISYVCGDASAAYVPVVDKMWRELLDRELSPAEQQRYYGDAKLKTFDRHLIFVRPGTVLIYDVLASEEPQDWSWLLHTYEKPELDAASGTLRYRLPGAEATARVFASQGTRAVLTDQFPIDPRPLNVRYRNAPNQYHISWNSREKSREIRFLAVIQCVAPGETPAAVEATGDGEYRIGGVRVKAVLNPALPAAFAAEADDAAIFINQAPTVFRGEKCRVIDKSATLMMEKVDGRWQQTVTGDMAPKTQAGTLQLTEK